MWLERLKKSKGARLGTAKTDETPIKNKKVAYLALPKPTKPSNDSFVSGATGPFSKIKKILLRTPFTLQMIDLGLILWAEPFDQSDLNDIEQGLIESWQAIEYLDLWRNMHPEKYSRLNETQKDFIY